MSSKKHDLVCLTRYHACVFIPVHASDQFAAHNGILEWSLPISEETHVGNGDGSALQSGDLQAEEALGGEILSDVAVVVVRCE